MGTCQKGSLFGPNSQEEDSVFHDKQVVFDLFDLYKNKHDFRMVEQISITKEHVKRRDFKMMREKSWKNLRFISLGQHHPIKKNTLKAFTRIKLPALRQIYLKKNQFDGWALARLCRMNLPMLFELDLTESNIGSGGAKFLFKLYWKQFAVLRVDDNPKIGDEFTLMMMFSAGRQMKTLYAFNCWQPIFMYPSLNKMIKDKRKGKFKAVLG